jgi:hypothetical protein
MKKLILSVVLSSVTMVLSAADKPAAAGACCSKTEAKAKGSCSVASKDGQCSKQGCTKQALLSPKAAAETTKRS